MGAHPLTLLALAYADDTFESDALLAKVREELAQVLATRPMLKPKKHLVRATVWPWP